MKRTFVALTALLGLAAAQAGETPRWPPPPEPARYEFAGALHGERDVAPPPGFWERVLRFFTGGREEGVLVRPYGVTVTRDGLLAVADPGLPGVHLFDIAGKRYRAIRAFNDENLVSPIAVAETAAGTLVVTDSRAGAVYEFSTGGDALRRIGQGALKRPTGIAVHPRDGRLFVTDTLAQQIVVFSPEGRQLATIGRRGAARGEFNYPVDVAFDAAGRLYVTDTMNFRVQVFDAGGKPLFSFGRLGDKIGDLSKPKGVAVDRHGRIYVVESYFDHLLVFDNRGRLLLAIGGNGAQPGHFNLPAGVAVRGDLVYLADAYNRRVQIFRALPAPVTPAPGGKRG